MLRVTVAKCKMDLGLNKLSRLLSVVGFWLITLTVSAKAELLAINDVNWPPFFIVSDTPTHQGIQHGLAKALLAQCINAQQYQLQYNFLPIKRTHVFMQLGKLDITVYSHKKEREQYVYYSKEPLFYVDYGFASPKDAAFSIHSLADIEPLKMGNLEGLAHTPELLQLINQKKQRGEVELSHSLDELLLKLVASPPHFDITANALPSMQWRAKTLGVLDQIKVHPFVLKRKAYYLTVSKRSKHIHDAKAFIAQFDQCIADFKQHDDYQILLADYGLANQHNQTE